jgi:hypothetical protein
MTIWHVMGRFIPDQSLPNDPNHIALVDGSITLAESKSPKKRVRCFLKRQ